jgi:adenine-specific DNA-methyltransferase
MAQNKKRLELRWVGKENRPQLEPRVLIEDPDKSYHAAHRVSEGDIFDNRLIFGDNLLALQSLKQEFSNQIMCIYIDPPFNTGEMFEHYEDGVEHSIWLSQMRDRIDVLHQLLKPEGTFCIHIDDNELGYLIAVCDEIFGRRNRCYIVTFKQSSVSGPKAINPGLVTTSSYILIYAKDKSRWTPDKVYTPAPRDSRYNKYIVNIDEPFSDWQMVTLRQALAREDGCEVNDLKRKYGGKEGLEKRLEEFVLTDPRRVVRTARVAPKDISESCREPLRQSREKRNRVLKGERDGSPDMFFLNGEQLIFYSSKAKKEGDQWITGIAASTIWDDLLSNNLHNEGLVRFPNGKKPEGLIRRILKMTTHPGDWVLDSFAGSGTTGAVAQKMGRRWVMVELLDHCHTHIIPRMQRVIDGKDLSGVTRATDWGGGGGFRYYKLGPTLIVEDEWGNPIINPEFNAGMLTEAMCKLEGFTFDPNAEAYWQQGRSSETDFIYVTTQFMSKDMLTKISDEVGPNRSLLICCSAFRCDVSQLDNLSVKKIPKAVLKKCEWGHDDYSLEIENLPDAPPEVLDRHEEEAAVKSRPVRKFGKDKGPLLFDMEDSDTKGGE